MLLCLYMCRQTLILTIANRQEQFSPKVYLFKVLLISECLSSVYVPWALILTSKWVEQPVTLYNKQQQKTNCIP